MTVEIHTSFDAEALKQIRRLDSLVQDTMKGIRRASYLIGKELVKDAKRRILKGPKTGLVYILARPSGRTVRHQASAPGQSPANFSGALRGSVGFRVQGPQLEFGAGGSVESGRLKGRPVAYARILELGGLAGRSGRSRILPRPYLKAAIDGTAKTIRNYYEQEIKKQLIGKIKTKTSSIKSTKIITGI